MSASAGHDLSALAEALPDGVVDAHHHLWDLNAGRYPWLQDEYLGERFFLGPYRSICRDFDVDDLRQRSAPLRLAATVHIEAERDRGDQVGETRWVEGVHERAGLPSVIVGHVSFLQHDLDAVLRAHAESPLFRGVRSKPLTSAGPAESVRGQAGSLQDERWLAGLAKLVPLGLSWDLRVPFWHLEEAARVAAALPDLAIVVNHAGLPLDRSDEGLAAWRLGLAAIAQHANVTLKLSEFGLAGGGWDEASTVRVVRDAAAIFGDERLLYASNLPVSSLSAPVPRIVAATLAGLGTDPDRLRRVFSSNARRVYRI